MSPNRPVSRSRDKRKHTRFEPDPLAYALVDPDGNKDKSQFQPEHIGLILQESHGGCGLVISNRLKLDVGSVCYLRVGSLPVMKAEVRWLLVLDKDVSKAGFMYLE